MRDRIYHYIVIYNDERMLREPSLRFESDEFVACFDVNVTAPFTCVKDDRKIRARDI